MSTTQSEFHLRKKLAVLGRNRRLLIVFVASAMISSLALTFVFSERYRASTTIMYRPTEAIDIQAKVKVPELTTFGFPVPTQPFEVIGKTIEEIGTSERVLRKVVVELGLDREDTTERSGVGQFVHETKQGVKKVAQSVWELLKYGRTIEENPTTTAIVELMRNTSIESRKNYTSRLVVVDKDPLQAAAIVDKIAEELVSALKELSVQRARDLGRDLEARKTAKKAEIDRVRAEIEDLKSEHDFVALGEETTLHLQSKAYFEKMLLENYQKLSDARARMQSNIQQRQSLDRMLKTSETVQDDPLYSQLRTMKVEYEVEREGLLKRFPADHPEVVSLEARIQSAVDSMAGIEARRVTMVTTQLNDLYQTILADEAKLKAEIDGLEATESSLKDIIERVRSQIAEPSVESKLNELELELQLLETDYTQLATTREEARVVELASVPEVQVLYPATPMDAPFRPIKIYHVLLSGFLAVVIGVGVIYLLDYWRALWRTEETTHGERASN